jgi:hypothetical protein
VAELLRRRGSNLPFEDLEHDPHEGCAELGGGGA